MGSNGKTNLFHVFFFLLSAFLFHVEIKADQSFASSKEKRADNTEDNFLIDIGNVKNGSCTVDKQLTIEYSGVIIECAEEYHLAGFENPPILHLHRANVNRHYTLMMVDPDAPSANTPKYRSWLHWLIVNIKDADINTGFPVKDYAPPTPPPGSGFHRYVFLLVEQTEKHSDYMPIHKRSKFDVNDYAKRHKLGNLAGITFFKTEHAKGVEEKKIQH